MVEGHKYLHPSHPQILRRGKKVSAGLAGACRRMSDLHAKAGSKEQVAADRAAFKGGWVGGCGD